MADRYPAHPRTPDALRWLIRHGCSSAARRRGELGQFVASGQVSFGQPKEAPAPMPPADGKGDADQMGRGGVTPPLRTQFENRESMQVGRVADNEVVRKWYQGVLELEPRLAAFGPVYAGDPAMQFCLQSARRNLGDLDAPKKWYADFVSRQPEGPWRNAAAAELWLTGRAGSPPKVAVYCHATDERPYLDGKLDDAAWQGATPLPLRDAAGASAGEFKTEARMAYDHEFFYLAVRCAARPSAANSRPSRGRTTPTCAAMTASACCSTWTATTRLASISQSISAAASPTTAGATRRGTRAGSWQCMTTRRHGWWRRRSRWRP